MTIKVSAASAVGRVRENNEDMLLVVDQYIRDSELEQDITINGNMLLAVSDGMGGHNAGELASEFVLQQMHNVVTNLPTTIEEAELGKHLDNSIRAIHYKMNDTGLQNPSIEGWGCTFTGIFFSSKNIYVAHIGDSRLYHLRGKTITQISNDHTLRNLLKDDSIPPNKIANAFGGYSPDIFLEFHTLTDKIQPGDKLLLCSDGLSGELTDKEIALALQGKTSANKLVKLANAKGGFDNISCIVITFPGSIRRRSQSS